MRLELCLYNIPLQRYVHAHLTIRLVTQKSDHVSFNLIFNACDTVHANTITPYLLYGLVLLVLQDYYSAKSSKLTSIILYVGIA